MFIAHLSDFHIFSQQSETALVRPDIVTAVEKIVADVASFSPDIEHILLSGDIADGGSNEDYALVQRLLSPLKANVYLTPGNHDRRATLRDAFAAKLPFVPGPYLNYEVSVGFFRLLAIDTLDEGQVAGAVSPETLDWLTQKIDQDNKRPTLLMLHHCPMTSGINALDLMSLAKGKAELSAVLARHEGPLHIFAGHIHRPFSGLWNGRFCAVAGSPAFQIDLNLTPGAPEPSLVQEPYAYFIYEFRGPTDFTVHTCYVTL